jgi:hypothetical protein
MCILHTITSAPTPKTQHLHELAGVVPLSMTIELPLSSISDVSPPPPASGGSPAPVPEKRISGICIVCKPVQLSKNDMYDAPYLLVTSPAQKMGQLYPFWREVYRVDEFPTHKEALADEMNRYISLTKEKDVLLNTELYRERLQWVFEPGMCDANLRAKDAQKRAHVIVSADVIWDGFNEEWEIRRDEELSKRIFSEVMLVFHTILQFHFLEHIETIEFRHFPTQINTCGNIASQQRHPGRRGDVKKGIRIVFSDPFTTVSEEADAGAFAGPLVSADFSPPTDLPVFIIEQSSRSAYSRRVTADAKLLEVMQPQYVQQFALATETFKTPSNEDDTKTTTVPSHNFGHFLSAVLPHVLAIADEDNDTGYYVYPSVHAYNQTSYALDITHPVTSDAKAAAETEVLQQIEDTAKHKIHESREKFNAMSTVLQQELEQIAHLKHRGYTLQLLKNKIKRDTHRQARPAPPLSSFES